MSAPISEGAAPSAAHMQPTDQPNMTVFSSILLLGSYAFQAVLGRPDAGRIRREGEIIKRSVDSLYVLPLAPAIKCQTSGGCTALQFYRGLHGVFVVAAAEAACERPMHLHLQNVSFEMVTCTCGGTC